MEQGKSDMVMRFTLDGRPVWAECSLDVAPGDSMMEGFQQSSYDSYSNFFEITDFEFGIALSDQDESVSALGQHAKQGHQHARPPAGAAPAAAKGKFVRWRSAKEDEYRKIKYPLEFDKFTFTRAIDGASPIFFQACCNTQSFTSAALVKRVSEGDRGQGSGPAVGFLRIDFKDVLITGVDWDDGEVIREKCTFICKAMRLQYRQQSPGGSLLSPVGMSWDQSRDGQPGEGRAA